MTLPVVLPVVVSYTFHPSQLLQLGTLGYLGALASVPFVYRWVERHQGEKGP